MRATFDARQLVPAVASHFRCTACGADAYVEPTHRAPMHCERYMAPVNSGKHEPRGAA